MSGDDIVERFAHHSTRPAKCDCLGCEAADEIERLRAEVERLEGQRKLRADLAYLFKAERDDERALADQLADALRTVRHDRPSAHTDNVWAVINHALITYEEARRG